MLIDDMFLLWVGFRKMDEALLQESVAGSYIFCLFFVSLAAPKMKSEWRSHAYVDVKHVTISIRLFTSI